MPKDITILQVFVASPGDVSDERTIVDDVVDEMNLTLPSALGLRYEVIK